MQSIKAIKKARFRGNFQGVLRFRFSASVRGGFRRRGLRQKDKKKGQAVKPARVYYAISKSSHISPFLNIERKMKKFFPFWLVPCHPSVSFVAVKISPFFPAVLSMCILIFNAVAVRGIVFFFIVFTPLTFKL